MTSLLEARNLHKRFYGVHALDDVSAAFGPGEVIAVMGENGAGKSTLMKCLAGVHQPTSGGILWEGEPIVIPNVARATELGIAFIHQELNLADNLGVGANVFLGREPRTAGVLIDESEIRRRTAEVLQRLEMDFSPDTLVGELSIGHQQMVEIAKALSQEARVLIMDEPTSSLTLGETRILFDQVRQLRDEGMCVVFISHRMAEVEEIADRVLVLRDGRNSGSLEREEIEHDRIVSLMVGRDLDLTHVAREVDTGAVRLRVEGFQTTVYPEEEVGFELKAGEIVGMAGLVGAGRTELARALFGIDRPLSGRIEVDGAEVTIHGPRDAIAAGIALVPEDRKEQGVILEMAIRDNAALPSLSAHQRFGFVNDRGVTAVAEEAKERLSIRTPDIHNQVGALSGGNQQKVVLGKWIALKPSIFLLDEPTRGIDVRSKAEIYEVIQTMAEAGAAILLISSDLEEILRVSDRALVLHEGRLAGELARDELSEEAVMQLATGAR